MIENQCTTDDCSRGGFYIEPTMGRLVCREHYDYHISTLVKNLGQQAATDLFQALSAEMGFALAYYSREDVAVLTEEGNGEITDTEWEVMRRSREWYAELPQSMTSNVEVPSIYRWDTGVFTAGWDGQRFNPDGTLAAQDDKEDSK